MLKDESSKIGLYIVITAGNTYRVMFKANNVTYINFINLITTL